MIEKVNPSHPDKLADRIAGAIVDLAYIKNENPKIAVEVLIGHNRCYVLIETSEDITQEEVKTIVKRIAGDIRKIKVSVFAQDKHLSQNQRQGLKCGDNGIFKGVPLTDEQNRLSYIAKYIYSRYRYDGKYILDDKNLIVCQSNAKNDDLLHILVKENFTDKKIVINPLGEWTGGTDVDSGATNRKLGSDMADSITGGGLHGKDLSKADVSVNIYAFLKAQETGKVQEFSCAIGDDLIDGKPYSEIVEIARKYINEIGGFEKFAEWGLF